MNCKVCGSQINWLGVCLNCIRKNVAEQKTSYDSKTGKIILIEEKQKGKKK